MIYMMIMDTRAGKREGATNSVARDLLTQQGTYTNEDQITNCKNNCHLDQQHGQGNEKSDDTNGNAYEVEDQCQYKRHRDYKNKHPEKNHRYNPKYVFCIFHLLLSIRFAVPDFLGPIVRSQLYADSRSGVPTKILNVSPEK